MVSFKLMTAVRAWMITLLVVSTCFSLVHATISANETDGFINISNDRLAFAVNKRTGSITTLSLDGQNLLGSGRGPYLDCHCTPAGQWTPGSGAKYTLFQGTDQTGENYGGVRMSQQYQSTGKILEQYWFLRDSETGLHVFARAAYNNATNPDGGDLGEMRMLFRPSASIWTHLSSTDNMYANLPNTTGAVTVQDATSYVAGNKYHPYVKQMSDYFTKYMFSETWKDQSVHGIYSDGTGTKDGSTFGAWLVMNTKDTYYGGPTHSDLTVDGIVYNYITSNHHGNGVPAMNDGFDRTFGPQYYHFNKGSSSTSLQELRQDANKYANPEWNSEFYDSIAKHVVNLVPSSGRGIWKGSISLPEDASRAVAVLASNGRDFQDNNFDTGAYQYWGDIDASGEVTIPRVKAGTYRLTAYANGVFGQYTQDDIIILAGETQTTTATWTAESSGIELWRIGTPDKSCGEFRHGDARDTTRSAQPNEYRLYWPVHDFPTDFPEGVNFKIGVSEIGQDLNYVHWSVFGGKANSIRPQPYWENANNWTLSFDLSSHHLDLKTKATLTIQLAGAKTSAGNNDNADKPWEQLPYTVVVNGNQLPPWVIPSEHSSSCAVRSAATCYTTGHKFVFDSNYLNVGVNELVLSLPANATAPESAILAESVYVQYDALRLEVSDD